MFGGGGGVCSGGVLAGGCVCSGGAVYVWVCVCFFYFLFLAFVEHFFSYLFIGSFYTFHRALLGSLNVDVFLCFISLVQCSLQGGGICSGGGIVYVRGVPYLRGPRTIERFRVIIFQWGNPNIVYSGTGRTQLRR